MNALVLSFVVVLFLFLTARRLLYYQRLIQYFMSQENYSDALLCSKKIGNWWMTNYLSDKIEKNFLKLSSDQAVSSISALVMVGERKRARRILFNQARKRNDYNVLFTWYWKEVN